MEKNITKIFIIDDEESVVRLLMEYFNRLNYKCEGYFFDKDLLTSVREFMPDIIICDMNLQSTNGVEILTQLKQCTDLAEISFVFLTGSVNEVAIQKGFELGADECLMKPLDLAEIENQICHVLKRKQHHFSAMPNVLLINQNEARLDNLEEITSINSNQIFKAKNLKEAGEILQKNSIDLIISSANFMDGNILNFYKDSSEKVQNVYSTLIIDANDTILGRKARKLGINDFIYSNYGDDYFRSKVLQIIDVKSKIKMFIN